MAADGMNRQTNKPASRCVFPLLALLGVSLACVLPGGSQDPSGIATSLAQTAAVILSPTAAPPTAAAILSPTAAALTDTATAPAPTETQPAPTTVASTLPPPDCSDDSDFVDDINVPDGTEFAPNTPFTKIWRIRNSGTCSWSVNYQFVRIEGPDMGSPAFVPLPADVLPGEVIDISVDFVAPDTSGNYSTRWQLRRPDGTNFGTRPFVEIVVP